MNRLLFPGKIVRLPTSVKIVHPESTRALENAWRRRWTELAGWQPSAGWAVDPRAMLARRRMANHES